MAQNYILLQRVELNASATSITFSNIPQSGYTDLKIVVSARDGSYGSTLATAYYRFNGDSGANYKLRWLYGNGTAAGSALDNAATVQLIANIPGNTATANTFGNAEIYIPNYTSSNYKSSSVDAVPEGNATGTYQSLSAALWSNTAAINSITFTSDGNFAANSTFSLYGLAAVGTTPTVPSAQGGDVVVTDGTYWYHAFKSSGTFISNANLTCSVLQVAGGGAGFYGGGGAGGLLYTASRAFSAGSYSVVIGAGGAAPSPTNGQIPVNGNNSSITGTGFSTLTAIGGGGGGVYPTLPQGATGANGGSGGGAGVITGGVNASGGTATSGQGNAGGTNNNGSTNSAAGGGGAGAAGANVSGGTSSGGAGGAGVNTYSTWASATSTGVSGYYAGGGGGRGFSTPQAAGGAGGGGNGDVGGSTAAGSAGVANTGGGGGGGYGTTPNGYAGGSGITIIRYAV